MNLAFLLFQTGTRDPDWTEIIFVPDEFDELKALTTAVSPKAKECLTTDSNGNLSFKAFDANHLQPAAGALFVVSKHI